MSETNMIFVCVFVTVGCLSVWVAGFLAGQYIERRKWNNLIYDGELPTPEETRALQRIRSNRDLFDITRALGKIPDKHHG